MMQLSSAISRLQKQQGLLRVLIFSFVTVMVWIGFSLFQSQQHTGISPELQKMAVPLNPNIDLTVIERIRQKRSFSPQELQNFPIYKIIQTHEGEVIVTDKSQVPGETPTPTPSATPGPTPTAVTASGSATPASTKQ
jgi:hypothetical protein